MKNKKLQRLLVIVFGLAFVGSTGAVIVGGLLNSESTTASQSAYPDAPSPTEQLQSQAKGYAKVLEREPENPTALLGLLQISLQTGDLKTAISPLKKLVTIYPERKDLSNLLAELEGEIVKQSVSSTPDQETTPAATTNKAETSQDSAPKSAN